MVVSGSKLLLAEEGAGCFSTVLRYGDGTEKQLPATTPAKELITATEIDYRKYRKEIKRLRDEHPLFEDRLDIPVTEFEDFAAEALLLPAMLLMGWRERHRRSGLRSCAMYSQRT